MQTVLDADMTVSLALSELGRMVGAGERTPSRLFHNEIGMGFTVWRNQLRLHRVILLLADGRTVTHVSTACGFSSQSAFIGAFQASFETPGISLRRASAGTISRPLQRVPGMTLQRHARAIGVFADEHG